MTRLARTELLGLITAGAVGAGVHAAIAPEHLREWAPLGASFIAAAVLLAAAVARSLFDPLIDTRWPRCQFSSRLLRPGTS